MREISLAVAYGNHAPTKIDEAFSLNEDVKAPLSPQGLVKAWAESGVRLEEDE